MFRTQIKSRTNAYGVAKIKRATYNTVGGMQARSGTGWWAIRAEVWKRDGGMCVPHKRLGQLVPGTEVHHITALSKGGTTTKANLMVVCDACHNNRHTHLQRTRG